MATEEPVLVRCATYNLLHGIDMATGRIDLDAAARAIEALAVDVVALQEVDREQSRSGRVDQIEELAARLGWHGRFAAALRGSPDRAWSSSPADDAHGPAYGVGLLSRWPFARSTRLALPGGGDGARRPGATPGRPGWDHEPRVALAASITVDGIEVRFVSTHLSYLPWRAIAQLRAATSSLDAEQPTVLLGDLNLPAWVVRALLRRWDHAGGSPTYPAWRPRVQVDQALVHGGVVVREATVASASSSDHLPLICLLELPASRGLH